MIRVLDASAAVDALIPGSRNAAALNALGDADLYAPSIIDTEVMSALARLERAHSLTTAEADAAVEDWLRLPLERIGAPALTADAWTLRRSLRVTDAYYVALARRLVAPLITSDAALARSSVPHVTWLLIT